MAKLLRMRVKDKWHSHINGDEEPWVYSDHSNFAGDVSNFILWVAMHNDWTLDGVQTETILGTFKYHDNTE